MLFAATFRAAFDSVDGGVRYSNIGVIGGLVPLWSHDPTTCQAAATC
jgi:hypothetical protein